MLLCKALLLFGHNYILLFPFYLSRPLSFLFSSSFSQSSSPSSSTLSRLFPSPFHQAFPQTFTIRSRGFLHTSKGNIFGCFWWTVSSACCVKFDSASKGKLSCVIYYILKGPSFHFPYREGKSNEIEGFVGVETLNTVWNIVRHRVDQNQGNTIFYNQF